eukprot:TRINITY_DN910_c0_g2_i1.p1 TRINITY_DN910_c0_g2~~TRINITY_DN910_c0_g2_i1.p1  ORF type:complete len:235 (+),score=47.26 TRINITY_DN910_c0_g2_i1:360-1064(+)
MYRSYVSWSLGTVNASQRSNRSSGFSSLSPPAQSPAGGSASGRFLTGFSALESAYRHAIYERGLHATTGGPLRFTTQKHAHLSLAYFCCLTETEAHSLEQTAKDWILGLNAANVTPLTVVFKRLECWQELEDSITNILVVDKDSNRRLLLLHDDLVGHLRAKSIPVVLRRQRQMPFHTTLLAVRTADKSNISSLLPAIADVVKRLKPKAKALGFLGHTEHVAAAPEMSPSRPMG